MTTVVVDKELRDKFNGFEHEVIFCDESGQPVGRFLPQSEYMKMLYERARHMFTEEELVAARRPQKEYTTAEVIEHLNKL
jgi:CRISPR/Cas system-associated endonuclease Cas1